MAEVSTGNIYISDIEIEGSKNTITNKEVGFSPTSNSSISNLTVEHMYIRNIRLGISVSGNCKYAEVKNNILENIKGKNSGEGYGIHIDTKGVEDIIKILNNKITNASRHGIYVAHTKKVTLTGNHIKDHRKTVYEEDTDKSIRVAVAICRSQDITFENNHIIDCYGGALMVSSGKDSNHNDVPCKKIIISNNLFQNYPQHGIHIGYLDPRNDAPFNVKVSNNTFRPNPRQTSVVLYGGYDINIEDNKIIYDTDSITSITGINIAGYLHSTFSQDIFVKDNIKADNISIRVGPSIFTGICRVTIDEQAMKIDKILPKSMLEEKINPYFLLLLSDDDAP